MTTLSLAIIHTSMFHNNSCFVALLSSDLEDLSDHGWWHFCILILDDWGATRCCYSHYHHFLGASAPDVLKQGLSQLMTVCDHIRSTFEVQFGYTGSVSVIFCYLSILWAEYRKLSDRNTRAWSLSGPELSNLYMLFDKRYKLLWDIELGDHYVAWDMKAWAYFFTEANGEVLSFQDDQLVQNT